MSRLIGFGCSLSIYPGWIESTAEELSVDFLNLSVGSGNNKLQAIRFQEIVLENNIKQDDIIIWQLTSFSREFLRIKFVQRNKRKLEMDSKGKIWPSYTLGVHSNIFDNFPRADVLAHSSLHPLRMINFTLDDEEQLLEDMLFFFICARLFTKNILIFRGWDDVMTSAHWEIFKKELSKREIESCDISLIEWVQENNLSFKEDGSHPSEESSKLFGKSVIVPLIKNIILDIKNE